MAGALFEEPRRRNRMGIRFVFAVLTGGVVASMTDWLFMGDLVYKRFDKHPEIWRFPGGQGESKAIALSAALPFLTCAVFDILCVYLHLFAWSSILILALSLWIAVALPMIITNAVWRKSQCQLLPHFQSAGLSNSL